MDGSAPRPPRGDGAGGAGRRRGRHHRRGAERGRAARPAGGDARFPHESLGGDGPRRRPAPRLQDLSARGHGRAGRRGHRAPPRRDRRPHPADRGIPEAAAPAAAREPGHGAGAGAPPVRRRRGDGARPPGRVGVDLPGVSARGHPRRGPRRVRGHGRRPGARGEPRRAAGPDRVGPPTRVRPPGAVGQGCRRPRSCRGGAADRARRHGRQHGRRRRGGRHRGAPGAPARGRPLGRGRLPLGSDGRPGVRPRRRRESRHARASAARWTTATGRPSR